MKQLTVYAGVLFLAVQSVPVTASPDSLLAQYAAGYLKNAGTVGISIGVTDNGKMYAYHAGEAANGGGVAPTNDNIYAIGSVAKTFAATLIAQAVTEGKCTLHDDIRRFLPQNADYAGLTWRDHPIRLVHLCNHTSRIPSQLATLPVNWSTFSNEQKYAFKKEYTKQAFLKDLQRVKPDTLPGTRYEYSNAAVKLLTLIIEKIYQRSYTSLLEEYIKKEIGLFNTTVFLDSMAWSRFANGAQERGILMRTKNIDDFTSGPGLNTTIYDMLRYLNFQMAETSPAVRLTHQQTWQDETGLRIGLIWRMEKLADNEVYFFHSGQGWGCNSFCIFSVKRKAGVVILVNETTNQKNVVDLGTQIFKDLFLSGYDANAAHILPVR